MLALALSYIPQEDQDTINFAILPKRRRMGLRIAKAFSLKYAYFAFSVAPVQRPLQILFSHTFRFRRDDVDEAAAGNCRRRFESFCTLVHPGDATRRVQCIDFVRSAIRDAGYK